MIAATVNSADAIANYLKRVQGGLKQFDTSTQQEILSEMQTHIRDRVEEFEKSGSPTPIEDALIALGDPSALARQFSEVSVQQTASRSFVPWVLLRAAARMMIVGAKGTTAFLLGLTGYASAMAFFVGAFGKLFYPDKFGFWVGPHGIAWGSLSNLNGERELAGSAFIYLSLILAFVTGSATTLLLRWLLRPSGLLAAILQRLR
jgi:uncharacterized membrane protein